MNINTVQEVECHALSYIEGLDFLLNIVGVWIDTFLMLC